MILPISLFSVWADFGPVGQGFNGDGSVYFDDAVDQYIEARNDGYPARVWRLEPTAGIMADVTGDADDVIRRRCMSRHLDLPEWLYSQAIAAE